MCRTYNLNNLTIDIVAGKFHFLPKKSDLIIDIDEAETLKHIIHDNIRKIKNDRRLKTNKEQTS